jgi:hypothetical protein
MNGENPFAAPVATRPSTAAEGIAEPPLARARAGTSKNARTATLAVCAGSTLHEVVNGSGEKSLMPLDKLPGRVREPPAGSVMPTEASFVAEIAIVRTGEVAPVCARSAGASSMAAARTGTERADNMLQPTARLRGPPIAEAVHRRCLRIDYAGHHLAEGYFRPPARPG